MNQTEAITLTDAELEAVHGGYGGDCTPPPPPCGGGAPSYSGSPYYGGGAPSYSGSPSYSGGSPFGQSSPFDSGSGSPTAYTVVTTTTYYMGAPSSAPAPSACGGY